MVRQIFHVDLELIRSAKQRQLIDKKAQLKTFSGPDRWNVSEVFKVDSGNSSVVRCENPYIHSRIAHILFRGQDNLDLNALECLDHLRAKWMNADVVDNETWCFYLNELSSDHL